MSKNTSRVSSCTPAPAPPRPAGVFFVALLGLLLAVNSWAVEISGNYIRKNYALTEETWGTGNFELCRATNVKDLYLHGVLDQSDLGGEFDLHLSGNVRGLYVNGVKQDAHVRPILEPLALAVDILDWLEAIGGSDAETAWLWTCEWLIANPAATYGEWQAAYVTWAEGSGNMVYSAAAFTRIRDEWFTGQTFVQVRDATTAQSLAAWLGQDIQTGTYE
jgi:hypothetical protein